MKSGFVALVGRSNVGKSTILNKIIGKKISIVTPKSQTTRNSIQGIYNSKNSQIIFVDTPGIHKPKNELGIKMDKQSYSSIRDCDLALFVVDASKEFNDGDEYLFEHLKFDCPLMIIFNKIDETNISLITDLKNRYIDQYNPIEIIETCGLDGFGIDNLIKKIEDHLEEGPQYYDLETTTDKDLSFRVQEIIREKMLLLLKEEVPHSSTVRCESINTEEFPVNIFAKIIVEKESQKGIVIGSKGKMIKRIGTLARQDIEKMIGKHVNLQLVVQVVENWRNSSRFLVDIGY
ncbi:MAG: GTPase Era [Bacilli bacterium]|nr:GTPase Era [Bacilli bacterium]